MSTFESVVGGGLVKGGAEPGVVDCRLLDATETLEGDGARISVTLAILARRALPVAKQEIDVY